MPAEARGVDRLEGAAQMGKNIVICCDGTGNSFENPCEESNVVKLYSALKLDANQIGYYHPGVGTMGDPTAHGRLAKEWSRLVGLAIGSGLLPNVGDAYRYLMTTMSMAMRFTFLASVVVHTPHGRSRASFMSLAYCARGMTT
jgi:uncharacterized protein (DUF2235 family)